MECEVNMRIKFKFGNHSERSTFSRGDIFILPVPFFKYVNYGRCFSLRIGILFLQFELSVYAGTIRKLTIKQTQTKAG